MTDQQFLKRMLDLTEKLARASSARPYDPDAYNAVLDEIRESSAKFNRIRRRQAWYRRASIVVLACVLAWSFYKVLCWLKI